MAALYKKKNEAFQPQTLREKEGNTAVLVTCLKVLTRLPMFYVFSVLKITVLWQISQMSRRTADSDQQNLMSSCCSFEKFDWRGGIPFSPWVQPQCLPSDGHVCITQSQCRCETFEKFHAMGKK